MRAEADVTLVVLQHGMWGRPLHMEYIEKTLKEVHGEEKIVVLNAKSNNFGMTYDGVDVCGQRLANEIQSFVQDLANTHKRVTRCAMIGYSLGGLIVRYAIGILGREGFFDTIEPISYAAFAAPHLGARRAPESLYDVTFNFFGTYLLSRTGDQLQLCDNFQDGQRLLEVLADPQREYFQYLARFKHRTLYANLINERTITFWSSTIQPGNPYRDIMDKDYKLTRHPDYPSVITSISLPEKPRPWSYSYNRWYLKYKDYFSTIVAYALAPLWFPLVVLWGCYQHVSSRMRLAKEYPYLRDGNGSPRLLSRRSSASSSSSESVATESSKLLQGVSSGYWSINDGDDDTIMIHLNNPEDKRYVFDTTRKKEEDFSSIRPLPKLYSEFKSPTLSECQLRILHNLGLLSWNRVLLYIDSVNAHATMICRTKEYINDDGRVSVKHFVDTIQL